MDASAASSGMNDPRGNLDDPTSSLDGPRNSADQTADYVDSVDYPGVENVDSPCMLDSTSTSVIPMEIQLDKS